MKQILQNLKYGETILAEVPAPKPSSGKMLLRTTRSLISTGTERMIVDFGKAGWVAKTRQQPERVRLVLDKMLADGFFPTVEAVRSKLDQPIALGYCNVGVVQEVGNDVLGFCVGDRVVSNGPHAEVVCMPLNLCARIPDNVADEEAVFTVLGAIALQGIRLLKPTIGECFVVTGLGLIGQLAVQILSAHGCRVLGLDMDMERCRLAERFGAEVMWLGSGEGPLDRALSFSRNRGVDGVLVTAATKSSEPISQAAAMCRKRGRLVLTGVTGLELRRSDFYEKELSFQVSCSYGPGRYDTEYEEKGIDYPYPYVRWTEQRNFEAVLDLMAAGKIDVKPLITHRFPIDEAPKAYELIAENREPYLGILLTYPEAAEDGEALPNTRSRTVELSASRRVKAAEGEVVVGMIGAGGFTSRILGPSVGKTGARLRAISSTGGVSGTHVGRKLGFEKSTTDNRVIFDDPEINTVFITTRHNTHAKLVLEALSCGKHVFVEKPLCLTAEELGAISDAVSRRDDGQGPLLMVGFNRRFAPQVVKIRNLLETVKGPRSFVVTVNAGAIPADHWTQDPEVGGGRIIGEACHFVDLVRHLAGCPVVRHEVLAMRSPRNDTVSIQLGFEDGSMAAIHYLSNGHRRFPKERLEVFAGGRVLQLDNFRRLTGYGWPGFRRMNLWRQDKGHQAEVTAFIEAVREGGPSPIPFNEIAEVTRSCLEIDARVRG